MKTVETLNEGLKRAYTVTIAATEIEARVEAEIKTVAPQIKMPGFRPGKVPANLVRKMHGEAIAAEALQKSVQDSVQKVLADNKLRPAIQPSVELSEGYAHGQDAEIKVALEVLPDVPAPAIEGITLERLTVEVPSEKIDEQLQNFAKQMKKFDDAPAKHKAKTGDQVIVDFVGKVDDVAFDGGTGEGMAVELGSGNLIPGFEDQLVGVKIGDEKVLNVTFPEDYGAAELAGKPATFEVKVTAVKVPVEAAIDDDFAKNLGLESLEKLREIFKGQFEQELNGLTRTHMKRKLLDQLADRHDFAVPPTMVEMEFNQIWQQLEHEAGHEADPEAAKAELESDRDDYLKIAERRVRLGLLLSEIGQQNNVEVSQQEMSRLVMQAAQQYNPQDQQRFIQYIQQDPMAAAQLRAPLYEDKVVDFLFDKASISDRAVTRDELEAAIEADSDVKPHVHGPNCGHDHGDAPKAKKPAAKKAAAAAAEPAAEAAEPAKKPAAKKAKAADAEPAADAEKPAAKKPAAKKAPAKKADA
ncbi:trigger factor [Aquisediminimonas sediminicola]|uniref:trigger factor n=1 Tax=Alteraquisediminimonas sediminicola TaxID=2676787 RepID=UPI001C8E6494